MQEANVQDTGKSFLGEQRGMFYDVFGNCTQEGTGWDLSCFWPIGTAGMPPTSSITHAPTDSDMQTQGLSVLPSTVLSPSCWLGGKEEALHFLIISLECRHSGGCPATTRLSADSQEVCFLRETFWLRGVCVRNAAAFYLLKAQFCNHGFPQGQQIL